MFEEKVPFFGIEVEGPQRGANTLFIPGGCPVKLAEEALLCYCIRDRYKRVYFGAGGNPCFPKHHIPVMKMALKHGVFVAVEIEGLEDLIDVPTHILNKVYIIYSLKDYPAKLAKHVDAVKIEDAGDLVIIDTKFRRFPSLHHSTKLSNPRYSLDTPISPSYVEQRAEQIRCEMEKERELAAVRRKRKEREGL